MTDPRSLPNPSVLVVGGGPTGLVLAAELALARVDVAIVELRPTQELLGVRAGGLHARTIELFDQRGYADRFLAQGQKIQVASYARVPLDITGFPTRHDYGLALTQNHIERILAERVADLGVPIHRGLEVTGFVQDASGVDVVLSDGRSVRSRYLVGCDGGRSRIRKLAGIAFEGWDASTSYLLAEASLTEEPATGFRRGAQGIHAIGKLDGARARLVLCEPRVGVDEPTVEDLRAALVSVYGTDYGVHEVTWLSRFSDMARQAGSYRERRVLVAGDAAHVHSPIGGQGLNLGVHDAMNLGWKLAQVVRGISDEGLLDSYEAERHPFGARVLLDTRAQTWLDRDDDRATALRDAMTELLTTDDGRRRFGARMSGLDVHYDLGEGHPLLGRRVPDHDLVTDGRSTRLFELLHPARPVLLALGEGELDPGPWSNRVGHVVARCPGPWELPVLGAVAPPDALLIRPDGHVAWVGDGSERGLREALTSWCGSPPGT